MHDCNGKTFTFKTVLVILCLVGGILGTYYSGIINTNTLIADSRSEAIEKFTPKKDTDDLKEDVGKIKTKVQDIREEQIKQRVILNFIKDKLK